VAMRADPHGDTAIRSPVPLAYQPARLLQTRRGRDFIAEEAQRKMSTRPGIAHRRGNLVQVEIVVGERSHAGLEHLVRWLLGPAASARRVFAVRAYAVDVVLHTSVAPEPFGRVILEGMLAGRPVVAAGGGLRSGRGQLGEQSHRAAGGAPWYAAGGRSVGRRSPWGP